jgi:glutamyl-tRNA synthetase
LDAATRAEFTPEVKARVSALLTTYRGITTFKADVLQEALKATAKSLGVKPGLLVHPLRLAVTGSTVGPSLYHLLEIVGRDITLRRLDYTLGRVFKLT